MPRTGDFFLNMAAIAISAGKISIPIREFALNDIEKAFLEAENNENEKIVVINDE